MKIEKNIPIPEKPYRGGWVHPKKKYPFLDMAVGDSFLAPKVALSTMRRHNWSFPKTGRKYEYRPEHPDLVRIWRIS